MTLPLRDKGVGAKAASTIYPLCGEITLDGVGLSGLGDGLGLVSALGEFEQLVLFAVLRLNEDASGVAIHDEIEARTGRDVSPGAIYTTLGRLEERGLVRSVVMTAGSGRVGRPRKAYTLRPAGAKALRDAYDSLQALAVGFLPKLTDLAKGR